MKQSRVWTVFYATSVIIMLILLHGCAGTMQTHTTQSVPLITTETRTKVEQRVKNPETGDHEMMVVSEERARTVSTTTSTPSTPILTTEEHTLVWKRGVNPETGVSEMQLVSENRRRRSLR